MLGAYEAIPLELRELKNWCLWKRVVLENGKTTKVPYQPDGRKCDVTNAETFNTFNVCYLVLATGDYDGLGFIFTNTPYAGIDLDDPAFLADGLTPNPNYQLDLDRQIKISREFDSYSEVSPSGKGLHIIVKGSIPKGINNRKAHVELYSTGHYFTMTGQVHNNKPVKDYHDLLNQLWTQIGGKIDQPVVFEKTAETSTDDEVIQLALTHNAEVFSPLHAGSWQGRYPSQSEADQAYLNIVAYYTNSKAQVERIFRNSKLMRAKANKNKLYLPNSINKAFDQKVAPINFEGMKEALADKLGSVAQRSEPAAHNGSVAGSNPAASTISYPSGLLGEIAKFIYASAPRPVMETAIAAAIAMLAGITGRAYNISGTGLNQYVLLLAMTGTGKEAAGEGIDKLMNCIKMQVPTSTGFIGPGELPSGTGLIKHLANKSQSFVSVVGEFGLKLQQMSSRHANGAELSLKRVILDLYNKSGFARSMPASAYSKKEDNNSSIPSPAFTLLGESTPERFYEALTEEMISEGLLPRFLLIEYKGNRPPLNPSHTSVDPDRELLYQLAAITAHCEGINHSSPRRVINVDAYKSAAEKLYEFDKFCDNKINSSNKDVIRQLWNRAHIKVLKLAALIAVGENMVDPVITVDGYKWSRRLVEADIKALTIKFEAGEIGNNTYEIKQSQEILRTIKDYIINPYEKAEKYMQFKCPQMHQDKVVPYGYLNKRLSAVAVFKNDKAGSTFAIKRSIQNLIDADVVKELGKAWTQERFGTGQRCFALADLSVLDL